MYPDHLPLRGNLRTAHSATWRSIASAGDFWRGRDRIGMVAEARAALRCRLCARRKEALSPMIVGGTHDSVAGLTPAITDAVHRIRTDSGRLTKTWFDDVMNQGVTQQAYVEMVSVVCSSVIIDTLCCSLGLDPPALPDEVEGNPIGHYDTGAVDDGAWLLVSADDPVAAAEIGWPSVPYIRRAMGLVPSAVSLFFQTFRPHYTLTNLPLAISQSQAEFVAARVSALNECFY